jgi:membrane protein YdbS with pleckstrin-like domain
MSYARRLLSRGEEVVFESRQHWFAIIGRSWPWLLAMLIGIALAIWMYSGGLQPDEPVSTVLTVAVIALVVIPLVRIALILWAWQNQEYLITTRRVIKAEGIFNKSMADSSLEKINDARLDQPLIGRIFGYGTLDILTAAEEGGGNNVDDFPMLADPVRFKVAMLNQKEMLERPELAPPARQHRMAPEPMQRTGMPPRAGSDRVQEVPEGPGPVAVHGSNSGPSDAGSLADTLERLAQLRDKGLITEEEFQAKKRQLLERI